VIGGCSERKVESVRQTLRLGRSTLGRKGGGFRTTLVMALCIVILSVALGVGISRLDFMASLPLVGPLFDERPERTTTGPVVVEGIQRLDQLATVRWTESVPITKESGGSALERFLVGEKVVLVAAGEVEAGVDLANLGQDDVEVDGRRVTIKLPEPEILGASLDEEKTAVYDQDKGLILRLIQSDDELVGEARREAEREITSTAEENGILDYAESNARDGIRAFVTTLGFEEVEFAS
jgi:hypothetical protein